MDWLNELIKKYLKDGVLDQEGLAKAVNTEFPKHAVPKDKYNEVSETKKKLETDIKARDKQLEDLKAADGDVENLKATITQLQTDNKTAKDNYDKQLEDMRITNAIKLAITGKVQDEDIVAGLIDKDIVRVSDDGTVTGLEEQINNLKENKNFLFKDDTKQDPPGFHQQVGNNNPPDGSQMNDDAIARAFGNVKEE